MEFWQKHIKKTVFTLNVDNYEPKIRELTYPFILLYAQKIGAQFFEINKRQYPEFPPVYEKLQIYELGQQMENDWNIYFDADALVHPDLMDITELITKDTVLHYGNDLAGNRFVYDRYFRRDGRNIGSGNWFTIASDWCIDLWKPLTDLTLSEAVKQIFPTQEERNTIITSEHLLDDYVLSRNIAKYGLKFKNLQTLLSELNLDFTYLWHQYTLTTEEKIMQLKQVIRDWEIYPLLSEPLRSQISKLRNQQ